MVTGNKPTYSYRDPLLDHLNKELLHTSIRIGPDGCSFCILNLESKTYLGLEHYDFSPPIHPDQMGDVLRNILEDSIFFQNKMSSVSLDIDHQLSVIIPEALFIPEKAADYLQVAVLGKKTNQLAWEKLRNTDAYVVYYLPKVIKQHLEDFFKNIHIHHFSSTIIDSVVRINKAENNKQLLVHHSGHRFQLIYSDQKQLLFYNDYAYSSTEDYIYFLLYAMKQLDLSPESTPIVLIGEVDRNSKLYDICYKYIRNISFGNRPKELHYSYVLKDLAEQYHFNLYNQYLCES